MPLYIYIHIYIYIYISDSGHHLEMKPYIGHEHQQWEVHEKKIKNRGTGKVMDISGGHEHDGAEVIAYDYNDSRNQHWHLEHVN